MWMRRLGRTGRQVSVLGLGGHTYPVGNGPDDFRTPDERAALVARLAQGGVNYFDTTWRNEVELLADSFRRTGLGSGMNVSLQYVDGVSDPCWRDRLRGELECRLEIMGYPRAPLFLMGVGNERPPLAEIAAAAEALAALKQEGLVEHIGLSCHDLEAFAKIAEVIEKTDTLDYLMLRFNWKFRQASERLFGTAAAQDVGIVGMKVLCWDCGPENWDKRISVFEPLDGADRAGRTTTLNAAQQSLRWCLQNGPCATTVPAMNALWEAEQLLQAVEELDTPASEAGFAAGAGRLHNRASLARLAEDAESAAIRGRAGELLARVGR